MQQLQQIKQIKPTDLPYKKGNEKLHQLPNPHVWEAVFSTIHNALS